MKTTNLIGFVVASVFTLISTSAEAIPAFARKYDTKCSSCHSAYPQLNSAGRKFKEAGYAFPKIKGEKKVADMLQWDENVPVSIIVKSRPYDKKNPGDEKLRAIHEVEIISAGRFSDNVSGYVELEAEDEEDFNLGAAHAWVTARSSDALNVQVAWAPMLSADPYDTYSGGRRLTRGRDTVIDNSFGDVDGKIRSNRQTVSVFGRPIPSIFYIAGVSGTADDTEGENFATYFARGAFDISKNIMLGGLVVSGLTEAVPAGAGGTDFVACTGAGIPEPSCSGPGDVAAVAVAGAAAVDKRDYQRTGLDAQADIGNARVMASFMATKDDNPTGGGSVKNNAFYIHGQYAFKSNGRPVAVGLLRLDEYEKNNGADSFSAATFNLTYYFRQNIKGFVEYFDLYDGPTTADEKNRITFQAELAF